MKSIKKRNWAFVLYPESAPTDWIEQLQMTGIALAISPLHNSDLDPTGEQKKEHYHIILSYDGPTSYNVIKQLTDRLNQPIPQALEQVRGYYRYLTHKGNPEKFQYDENDIRTMNGFNISNFVELTKSEVNKYKYDIQKLIKDNLIIEYSELMDILSDQNFGLWEVASNHTLFFDRYITSLRNKLKTEKERQERIR